MKNIVLLACLLWGSSFAQEHAGGTEVSERANSLRPDADEPGFVQRKIEALEKRFVESEAVRDTLRRIKISGYVQARFTYAEDSVSGVDAMQAPRVTDGFNVRRARLKTQYDGPIGGALIQIDAGATGVTLKDAEASLTEPWSGKRYLTLTAGQTNWPFGYEVLQSSSAREFPERSRAARALFAGNRDRGAKLKFESGPLRAVVGVFDGNGIENRGFIGVDNDTEKDFYGRVAVDLKWFAAGVSGSGGLTYKPTDAAGPGRHYQRTRIGVDAQLYVDLLPFGPTAVKAEFFAGRTYQDDGVELFGQTALGWYGLLLQNIGDHEQVGFRYDFFDPATDNPGASQIHTFGLVASHSFDEVLKLSVSYEIPVAFTGGTRDAQLRENLFTVQLQARM